MLTRDEANGAANLSEPALPMDCRVKPGNDEMWVPRATRKPASTNHFSFSGSLTLRVPPACWDP
jgi:hypothetical protein